MCTVTLIPGNPQNPGFVLTMNRDEARGRREGNPYAATRHGVSATYPVDAAAGGTWVGLNDHGVCMALLNRYQSPSIADARSRGKIIAEAIHQGGLDDVLAFLQKLPLAQFNPFDLLIAAADQVWHLSWDREQPVWQRLNDEQPIMLTSSSERLPDVSAYRESLFNDWLEQDVTAETAEAFHRTQEEGREADAVNMSRPKVHTKSLVQIRVGGQQARLAYCDEQALSAGVGLSECQTFSLSLQPELLECSA